MTQQRADAETFFNLLVSTAEQRLWSMSICDIAPRQFAGLLHEDAGIARTALARARADSECVQKALRLAYQEDGHPEQQAVAIARQASLPVV